MIVIMNWLSTLRPCSEIDSGNHPLPLTNIQTEAIVITQIAIPRRRPISCLLQWHRLQSVFIAQWSQTKVCATSPIQDHHSEQYWQVKHRSQKQLARVLV